MGFQSMSHELMSELNKPLNDHTEDILRIMKEGAGDVPPGVTTEGARRTGESFQNERFFSEQEMKEIIEAARNAEGADGYPPRMEDGGSGEANAYSSELHERMLEDARAEVEKAQARLDEALARGTGVIAAQNALMEAMQWQFKLEQEI